MHNRLGRFGLRTVGVVSGSLLLVGGAVTWGALASTSMTACCTEEVDCDPCGAQVVVEVVDASTGDPVPNPRVEADDKSYSCRFFDRPIVCVLSLGAHSIRAEASGYDPAVAPVLVTGVPGEAGCGECCGDTYDPVAPVTLVLTATPGAGGAGGGSGAAGGEGGAALGGAGGGG